MPLHHLPLRADTAMSWPLRWLRIVLGARPVMHVGDRVIYLAYSARMARRCQRYTSYDVVHVEVSDHTRRRLQAWLDSHR